MRRSTFLTGLGVTALTAGLAACSGNGPASDQASGDITLRMTMWTSNPDHIALFEEIAEEFMAQEPSVTDIQFESLTLDQLDTVLTTGVTSGDAPDLTWLPVESSREYIEAGALLDVAPTLTSTEGYNYDDLVPALQERWQEGVVS